MKKIFSILALALVAMTVSAIEVPTYSLNKADGAEAHGTIKFYVGTDLTNAVTKAAEGATVTMTITPNGGWVVNTDKVTGLWSAAEAKAPGRRTTIDLLQDIDLGNGATDQTTGAVTYSFTMERANAEISATYKKLMTHPDITVTIDDVTYSGSAQTPTVTVKDGTTTLVEDTHYSVSYSNNTNAGTGTVTITGIGDNYAGQVTKTFKIDAAESDVLFSPWEYTKTYGDEDFIVKPSYKGDGTLSYSSKNEDVATVDSQTGLVHIVGVGRAQIYATLSTTSNYTGGYDWYVLTVNPKVTEEGGVTIVDGGNNVEVTINDQEDKLEGITLPEGLTVDKLNYSRQLSEGEKAYTVCLPYQPPTENLTYYTLVGVSEGTLYFDEIEGTPQAYTPYLVVANETTSIGKDNVTDVTIVKTVANEASAGDYVLKGTLSGIQHADAIGFYILQPGNRWGKVGSNANAYIPPFRAFVEAPATAAPELGSSFDGNTTGIENIRTVDLNGTERWYDLNGRRIATPAKGINILNGKKVVVK